VNWRESANGGEDFLAAVSFPALSRFLVTPAVVVSSVLLVSSVVLVSSVPLVSLAVLPHALSVVVMQLVLPLCPLSLRSLRLIALLRRLHREPARRLGLHGGKREKLLELLTLALRTNGHRFEDQRLEPVPALFALEIKDRHSLLQ